MPNLPDVRRSHAMNPFVWDRPITDPRQALGRDQFADEIARILKEPTNVALFGQRGTGKTTFVYQLREALSRSQTAEQLTMRLLYVDLDLAFSWEAMQTALSSAMRQDPAFARAYSAATQKVSLELGVKLGAATATVNRERAQPTLHHEIVVRLLEAIRDEGAPTVICFDEFQRLGGWGQDLTLVMATLRSTLMGPAATGAQISLLMTGSDRTGLQALLENSNLPLFNQADQHTLPAIEHGDMYDYLQASFEASGKPISHDAIATIITLASSHPRTVQRLAHKMWQLVERSGREGYIVMGRDVQGAWRELVTSRASGFAQIDQALAAGDKQAARERACLYMIADSGGAGLLGRALYARYGFDDKQSVVRALERLAAKAEIEKDAAGHWRICDPLRAGWLAANSPYSQEGEAGGDSLGAGGDQIRGLLEAGDGQEDEGGSED
jgi:hypothetical protein